MGALGDRAAPPGAANDRGKKHAEGAFQLLKYTRSRPTHGQTVDETAYGDGPDDRRSFELLDLPDLDPSARLGMRTPLRDLDRRIV